MYCGETYINEDLIKYLVAFGRMLQMDILENLANEHNFSGTYLNFFTTKKLINCLTKVNRMFMVLFTKISLI